MSQHMAINTITVSALVSLAPCLFSQASVAEPVYVVGTFPQAPSNILGVVIQMDRTSRVSFDMTNTTLAKLLFEFAKQAGTTNAPELESKGNTQGKPETISMTLEDVEFQDALRMFVRIGRPPWLIDNDVRKDMHRYRVTIHVRDAPWEETLRLMLGAFNLYLEDLSVPGFYIIVNGNRKTEILQPKP